MNISVYLFVALLFLLTCNNSNGIFLGCCCKNGQKSTVVVIINNIKIVKKSKTTTEATTTESGCSYEDIDYSSFAARKNPRRVASFLFSAKNRRIQKVKIARKKQNPKKITKLIKISKT